MSLHEMARYWNVSFAKVHAAACQVRGGKLPRGRTKWTDAEIDAICVLVTGHHNYTDAESKGDK